MTIKLHSRIGTFLLQKERVGEKILITGRRRVLGFCLERGGRVPLEMGGSNSKMSIYSILIIV